MSSTFSLNSVLQSLPISDFWKVLERGTDGVWLWNVRTEDVFWSEKMRAILGYSDEEELSIDSVMSLIHPEDRESHQQAVERSMASKSTYQTLVRIQSRQGEYIPLLANGIWVTVPGTEQPALLGYVNDQRPMIHANALVNHHQSRFEAFFNQCPAAVYVRDNDQRYVYANKVAAELSGATVESLVGARLQEVFASEMAAEVAASDQQALEKNKAISWSGEVKTNEGSRYIFDTKFPIDNISRGDKLIGGFSIDITAQKKAEELLESTQRLESLGLLASGVAHDFNNLLVGILGNAELLQISSADEQGEIIEGIIQSANRAARLCENLLLSAGRRDSSAEHVAVNQLLKQLVELLTLQLRGKATLASELATIEPVIECDPSQLRQIITNIVINATEATNGQPAEVVVSSYVTQDRPDLGADVVHNFLRDNAGELCCISIKDNGPGLQPDQLYRIFEPFYSSKELGAGIGLASVFGAVRANHGAVAVNSSVAGCEFKVYFPNLGQARAQHADQSEHKGDFHAKKVLIVDDEVMVADIIRRVLEMAGCETSQVNSGEEALQAIAENGYCPDLIVMDKSMPGISGPEALKKIRESGCKAPAIIVSGFHDESDGTADIEGVSLLNKPFSRNELLQEVERILGSE